MEKQYFFRAIAGEGLECPGLRMEVLESKPYWKLSGFWELSGRIYSDLELEQVQSLFAEGWELDTVQAERSRIFCPGVYFLWIGE